MAKPGRKQTQITLETLSGYYTENNGCQICTTGVTNTRYPRLYVGGRPYMARRVSLFLHGVQPASILDDSTVRVLSTCGESRCIAPAHLKVISLTSRKRSS